MKDIYWRPQGTPLTALILIAFFSIGGLLAVESLRIQVNQPDYREKQAAARLALEAMERIRTERSHRNDPINPEIDPIGSGLIGSMMTPVTSGVGSLPVKQTSVNPNFAAVVVDLLKKAKVKDGDTVAGSFSSSLPALNICVYAAVQTLKLKPVFISSAAASQWGANDPNFMWIDMENLLYRNHLFFFRSEAASIGGIRDQGIGLEKEGRQLLIKSIKRNDLPLIQAETVRQNLNQRMRIYTGHAQPKVFINAGGGSISTGSESDRERLKSGLNSFNPVEVLEADSLAYRFLYERIPVIHLEEVDKLAKLYGLPQQPTVMPEIGVGIVYYRQEYNPWLAGGFLLVIILGLYTFSRSEWGFRILHMSTRHEEVGPPEPMV